MTSAPIWHALADVPGDLGGSAVTIGNFDGVHRGHRRVIEQLIGAARQRALVPVALTFSPHPRHVMGDGDRPPLVTGYADRNRLLVEAGVEGVLDLAFTLEFAQATPEEFVRDVLVEGLGIRCIVVGEDIRFGRRNAGDITTMRELGERYGFDVVTIADHGIDAAAIERVSSSAVRASLLEGDVERAARMLGRLHTVTDEVHHGHKRGRELGFPTANLGTTPCGLVPGDGVYAGFITVVAQAPEHRGTPPLQRAAATISIGTNPTFTSEDGTAPRMVEAYVHRPHHLDLYGDTVRLEFIARQRPTLRFDQVEPLIAQMQEDIRVTRRTLQSFDEAALITC